MKNPAVDEYIAAAEPFARQNLKKIRATVHKAFPPSQQREYVDWIEDAKREETRKTRVATAVEWMAEGKRRNWKYEKR